MINDVDVSWSISRQKITTCQSCQSESRARQRTPPVSGATQAVHHLLDRIFHHQKISKETLPEFLEFIGIQLLDKHRTGFFCWTVLPGLLFVFDYSQVKNCQTRAIILPTQPAVATGAVRVPQADVSNALQPAIGEWFDTAKLDQSRKTWISCRLATSLQRTTLNICCNKYLQYFAICQYVDSVESSTIFSCHFCLAQLVEASAQHARSTQAAIGVLEGRCQVWASVNHFVLTCIDIIPNHPASIKIDDKYDNDIDDQYDNDIDDQYDHECLFEKVQYRSCWKVPAFHFYFDGHHCCSECFIFPHVPLHSSNVFFSTSCGANLTSCIMPFAKTWKPSLPSPCKILQSQATSLGKLAAETSPR